MLHEEVMNVDEKSVPKERVRLAKDVRRPRSRRARKFAVKRLERLAGREGVAVGS